MALTFRDGTVNIAAISTPGVAIDIIPPTPFISAAPTAIQGFSGVASWGTPNTVISASGASDGYAKLGRPQVRTGDLATALAVGLSQGNQGFYKFVRVTDGTDTAATATLPNSLGRFTARSSGTLGNAIGILFAASTAVGAYSAIVQFPGLVAERFDNIFSGLASVAVAPGAGYTSVPAAVVTPPQKALAAVQASVQPALVTTGLPTIATGGTGYAVGDTITLGGGIVLTVGTIGTNGVVTAVTVVTPGRITFGAVPSGVQSSTSGTGTGASFTANWVLGAPTFTSGGGYYAASGPALTITLQGGGATTPGTYMPTMSFAAALSTAINLGNQQRGKSGYVVFTPSTGTGLPSLGTVYTLSGGTDGANGVTSLLQAGQDGSGLSRTGAYVLRGSGMDCFTLVDCSDPTIVPAMLALAISETADFSFSTASGDTIANAIATRQSYGFDDTNLHFIVGDYPTFNDGINGPRLVYPSLFALALFGNLSPQLPMINKELVGVLGTQGSSYGIPISNDDNALAQAGGVDIIGRTSALGADYFTFVTGRSTSSNTAASVMEYSRLTNFIARSLDGPATRSIVGLLQSTNRADDPTRTKAKGILDSFFGILKSPVFGTGGYGVIEDAAVQCNLDNNPPASVQRGFLVAFCAVLYLNGVRVFLIKLNGGGNITIDSQTSQATSASQALASLTSAMS